jgi:hypothetical protein
MASRQKGVSNGCPRGDGADEPVKRPDCFGTNLSNEVLETVLSGLETSDPGKWGCMKC